MPESQAHPQIFTPVLLSRRGELVAWLLTLITTATWVVLRLKTHSMALLALALVLFLLLSALSISLGNWVDRRTVIRLTPDGVSFENGLRKVRFRWDEIQSVKVFPTQWGAKRVQVLGRDGRFAFRTLGEVKYRGEVKGQTGFTDGDHILQMILQSSGLTMNENSRNGVYYYARR